MPGTWQSTSAALAGGAAVAVDGKMVIDDNELERLPQIEARLAGRLHPSTPKDPT